MALRPAEVDQMWTKLGFDLKSGKDVFATLRVDGVIVVQTRRSHGAGKLDGNIPHFIRQKMGLNEDQFDAAIRCPLKKSDYFDILRAKNRLGPAK